MKPLNMLLAVAAVAVLTAVAAAPALAIETAINGSYQAQLINSNFNLSPVTTDVGDGYYHPEDLDKDAQRATFVEQRVRLSFTGKTDENLKLVTSFDIDYAYWGDSSYDVGQNHGGALGSDQINFETNFAYLDFNIPSTPLNVKVGMQGYTDAFEGILISSDAAGVLFCLPYKGFTGSLGLFRLFDDGDVPGDKTMDFVTLDTSFGFAEGLKAGASYYLLSDDNSAAGNDTTLHNIGLNAEAVLGPSTLNGFFLFQFGDAGNAGDIRSWAANVGANIKAGPGTVRTEFMYVPGDDDPEDDDIKALQTVSGEYGYYSNHLVILGRDEYALTTDNAIVYDVSNNGQGVTLLSAGYDLPLGQKTTLGATAGAAWVNEDPADHDGTLLGTEVNIDLSYQLFENLCLTARGAYVMLGNYYNGVAADGEDPADPYDVRLILYYSF